MSESLGLNRAMLRPGMRLAVAVSGGADSVALLRTLVDAAPEIGLVLSVAHVHPGIRGADADAHAEFVSTLAAQHGLAFHRRDVDAPAAAQEKRETLEEAGRKLRYAWFEELLATGLADAVATAHTLDDQAETVLHKLLRGAWTEGLSGIHPVVPIADLISAARAAHSPAAPPPRPGKTLRPPLAARRADLEDYLRARNQPWQTDSSNADE